MVADDIALSAAVERLAAGTGPVAVDAERASGYRYGQSAYLIQLRRAGSGTILVDPVPFADLLRIQRVIGDEEWILHAAHQDLPCLAELGLRPTRLFDTELAARLAGMERVGLASVVDVLLGYTLEKGHSAADWSTRPLPADWLRYAALDVELLIELRDVMAAELARQGKLEWAHEEFAAAITAPPKPPHPEPWRRTSGIHRLRNRRQLAVVRALWYARDARARERDVSPGRVLPDSAILAAAMTMPKTRPELAALPVFSGPRMRRTIDLWWSAISTATTLPDTELPDSAPSTGLPPAGRWADRNPDAAARLAAVRWVLKELAATYRLPVENALEPALQRRLAWTPPEPISRDEVVSAMQDAGARGWQIGLCADIVTAALIDPEPYAALAAQHAKDEAALAEAAKASAQQAADAK